MIDTTAIVIASLRGRGFWVFVDRLEMPPSQADLFAQIIDEAQVVATLDTDNRRVRIERVLWRFPERVELKPLPLRETEALVEQSLQSSAIRFTSERTRRTFVRHVARDSHGSPSAVRGMIQAAAAEDAITPAKARSFTHEAGVRYLDMTPAVVIGLVGFIALRYIARGINEVEMLVLSGVASALFMGLRFFMFRMSRRS